MARAYLLIQLLNKDIEHLLCARNYGRQKAEDVIKTVFSLNRSVARKETRSNATTSTQT